MYDEKSGKNLCLDGQHPGRVVVEPSLVMGGRTVLALYWMREKGAKEGRVDLRFQIIVMFAERHNHQWVFEMCLAGFFFLEPSHLSVLSPLFLLAVSVSEVAVERMAFCFGKPLAYSSFRDSPQKGQDCVPSLV